MNRFMLLLGARGLLASIVVHLPTFVPGIPVAMGQVWPLHVLLFIPFVAMIVRLKVLQPPGIAQREYQRALIRYMPGFQVLNFVVAYPPHPRPGSRRVDRSRVRGFSRHRAAAKEKHAVVRGVDEVRATAFERITARPASP